MSLFSLSPIPNLLKAKRVLCIQPHADDIDIACGGMLAVLADKGAHITYLTVTDGGAGSSVRRDENELANVRRLEQIKAGRYIGVQDYIWLNYRDADYLPRHQLQHELIRAIRQERPDTVVTIDGWLPYEAHPAHRSVGLSAAAAVLLSAMGNIRDSHELQPYGVQCIAFGFTAKPNTFVDVTNTWQRKMAAIRSHESQFPEHTWPFYEHYFEAKAAQHGPAAGGEKGEALKVFSPIHLHCNVDAENM